MYHVGKDGWLFLTGGSNSVTDQYVRVKEIGFLMRKWRGLILARSRRCRAAGARYIHLVVPEKLSVYDHKLDGLALDARCSPARRLGALLRWSWTGRRAWIDLVGAMRARRDERDLFHRTDTHWNIHGCLLAYRAICRACGAAPRTDFLDRPLTEFRAVLDIGAKLDEPPTEAVQLYDLLRDAARVRVGPLLAACEASGRLGELHVGAHAVFANAASGADPRTVVLFGDSCANFTPYLLTAMLAETFREVHFIWSSSLDWGYIERVRPALVVFEVVERFLPRVPEDDFDVAAYEAEKLEALGLAA
ncbi:hypothetical protein OPKNFCMD_4118 [Methylobacterium crusticola]|uniref:AlgX/AlgJ SGNH hydrolase-like domain-containing protein n=2 Tax=Methylobacterium crusticola TaxID=1697972 RepID=A0ABQ4R3C0_9HYPH|nr:hypothetical protein [Methylobacterium crusticola]GJD51364.1 hypothetical protein OPKNFCMD_4118 [Methylobacterium crusticola]